MKFATYLKRYHWNENKSKWALNSSQSFIAVIDAKDFNRAVEQIIENEYGYSYQSLRSAFELDEKNFESYTEFLKHKLSVYGNKDVWMADDEDVTEVCFVETDYNHDSCAYDDFKKRNKDSLAKALIWEIEKTKDLQQKFKVKCCSGYFNQKLDMLKADLDALGVEYMIKNI